MKKIKTLVLSLILLFCVHQLSYAQNPKMIKDIFPGVFSGARTVVGKIGNTVYFEGRDNSNTGFELWKTDGTEIGTLLVKDINVGPADANLVNPGYVLNGELYFGADDGIHGIELWKTDGTPSGTVLVKDINPNGDGLFSFYKATVSGSNLFFWGKITTLSTPSNINTLYLFKSDGSLIGTDTLIAGRQTNDISEIRPYATNLVYATNDGKLIKSNGLIGGTSVVYDVRNNNNVSSCNSTDFFHTDLIDLTLIGDDLYFFHNTINNGSCPLDTLNTGLWKYDLINGNLFFIQQLDTDSWGRALGTTSNKFIYQHYYSQTTGNSNRNWYSTDGNTYLGPHIFNPNSNFFFSKAFSTSSHTYFTADNGIYGEELWKTDGTVQGTELVKDFNVGPGSSYPYTFVKKNSSNEHYFSLGISTGSVYEAHIAESDGTTQGSNILFSCNDYGFIQAIPLIVAGDKLYFRTYGDSTYADELWVYDATQPITTTTEKIKKNSFINVAVSPNPTKSLTNISIALKKAQDVQLEIYSSVGQLIENRVVKNISEHNFEIDLSNYSSGIYYAKIYVDNRFETVILSKQ